MPTRDAVLKTGSLLRAQPVGKVLAVGTIFNGNSKPLDDNDCSGIADAFLQAIGAYSPAERAKILASVVKSGSTGFEVSGAGLATKTGDGLAHLDRGRAADMRAISSMTAANKALSAKLKSGLVR